MRRKIVAGNWKMNTNREEALSLVTEVMGMLKDEQRNDTLVIVAPPFVHIGAVVQLLKGSKIAVAAQNCSSEASGAFTGEVSALMISSIGAGYVIIGHSERRTLFGETNAVLAKKIDQVLTNNLIPIFCVGEVLSERENEKQQQVVQQQLEESVFHLEAAAFKKVIVAYEPVWAIGTGKTASPAQAQEMHQYIRSLVSTKYGKSVAEETSILYGGSCNESNAATLFSMADVDGGLIGGASLKSRSFTTIVNSF